MQFNLASVRVTVMNINRLSVSERKAAQAAATAGGKVLAKKVRQNISLTDHSAADLRRLGSPYARRHGSIRIHRKGSKSLAHPEFRIHTRSGALLNSLQDGPIPGKKPGHFVGFATGIAPHAVYVVLGTKVMLGRDIIWDTSEGEQTRKEMLVAIVKKLGPALRSGAAVRGFS